MKRQHPGSEETPVEMQIATAPKASSSADVSEPPPKRLCLDDAMAFIDEVCRTFSGEKENIYHQFLNVMGKFRLGELNVPELVQRVVTLFEGYDHLLKGFQVFMPTSMSLNASVQPPPQVDDSLDENMQDPTFREALQFINKVKERFADQPEIYEQFLKTLYSYRHQEIDITTVYEHAEKLLSRETDLWEDFLSYLPPQKKAPTTKSKSRSKKKQAEVQPVQKPKTTKQKRKKKLWRYGAHYDGPSYEMTEGLKIDKCSNRGPLEYSVLNDEFICVGPISGRVASILASENTSSHFNLLKECEETMVELDIMLQNVDALHQYLLELQSKIKREETVTIEKSDLKPNYRGVLRKVYADKTRKIIKALRSNPESSVSVILTRMASLKESWTAQKVEMTKQVRKAHEIVYWEQFRNDLKSFKLQEQKLLSEVYLMRDGVMRYEKRHPLVVAFPFHSVHRHIFKLFMGQSKLENEKIKRIWKQLFIPLFCLETEPQSSSENTPFRQINESKEAASFLRELKRSNVSSDEVVFYANTSLMILIRYYIIMYERLQLAQLSSCRKRKHDLMRRERSIPYETSDEPLSKEKAPQQTNVQNDGSEAKNGSNATDSKSPNTPDTTGITQEKTAGTTQQASSQETTHTTQASGEAGTAQQTNTATDPLQGTPASLYPFQNDNIIDDYHAHFMNLTQSVLSGKLEQQVYEEELMKYLGYNSYQLFTFVHVFEHFEKKFNRLLSDKISQRLLSCFSYEQGRTISFQDDLYFEHATRCLSLSDSLFEIVFNKKTRMLTIERVNTIYRDSKFESLVDRGVSYLKMFTDPNHTTTTPLSKVFLKRNLARGKESNKKYILNNGLEMKLDMLTMKFRYKEGTEDIFYRLR